MFKLFIPYQLYITSSSILTLYSSFNMLGFLFCQYTWFRNHKQPPGMFLNLINTVVVDKLATYQRVIQMSSFHQPYDK